MPTIHSRSLIPLPVYALVCKDFGMNCGYVARSESMEETSKTSMDHAAAEHKPGVGAMMANMTMEEMLEDMKSKLKQM